MNEHARSSMDAQDLTSLLQFPGAVLPLFENSGRGGGILAVDLGPITSTRSFAVPALSRLSIGIPTTGSYTAEGRVDGEFCRAHVKADGRNGLLLVPAGLPSEWRCHKLGICYTGLFLSPSLFSQLGMQALSADPAQANLRPALFFEDALLYQIGLAIARTMRAPEPGSMLYIESLGHTLGMHLLTRYARIPASTGRARGRLPEPILKQVLDYIESAPDADLCLGRLAELAHLSPYHFARLFRQTVGQTLHRYVLEQRLRKCYRLLLEGNQTLAEIAAETGFADESHLLRRFKHFYGVTPGALRKERKLIP